MFKYVWCLLIMLTLPNTIIWSASHYLTSWYVHILTESPGYLLIADSDSLSYYFTLSATLEAAGGGSEESQQLTMADGISGNTGIK